MSTDYISNLEPLLGPCMIQVSPCFDLICKLKISLIQNVCLMFCIIVIIVNY